MTVPKYKYDIGIEMQLKANNKNHAIELALDIMNNAQGNNCKMLYIDKVKEKK